MDQKELYIQYLEDALNHVKTGEPMKHWQMKCSDGVWENVSRYLYVSMDEYIELRIKPEPFKWTTFAYRTSLGIRAWAAHGRHYTREELSASAFVPTENILAIHHHEIEIE